ncbi:S9 family peptidase [Nonomuraea guangzhouensis]|uniref:DPP IV N-terminal domain-containing protein n=1 Tax=Nonomuraea guangzhouensis TaxID=1291555 RepID=A0ABW4GI95_9ACTN|nr:DPP IV N-terminal domain-containing protein [Nonomuraea guangzhouensis]
MNEFLDPAVYQGAENLLAHRRPALVRGGKVTPRWIDGGARFWYRADAPEGHWFALVDPAKGTREPAFDHERLAAALGAAAEVPVRTLPFETIELTGSEVEFEAFDGRWRCSLDSYLCERVDRPERPGPLDVRSPDGKWVVTRRGYDLWLRSSETGEERPLTTDGRADRTYGAQPDSLSYGVLMRKLGLPSLPPLVAWSPDSRRLVTHRLDQSGVPLSHLVESAPAGGGRPVLHSYHYAMPGEEVVPRAELIVFDVSGGPAVEAKAEPLLMSLLSPLLFNQVWWAPDGGAVYYLEQPRDLKTLRLNRLDPRTGEVRPLVEEHGEPRVALGQGMGQTILHLLATGREVLWYSQRDGWGHLYLYDTEHGETVCQVTSGEWAVQRILHVDEDERVVYFLASGLVEADPYRRQVCRARLDGTGFERLTDDDLDHEVTLPRSGTYFVDSASAKATPPVTTVRAWDGSVLVELERADVTALLEARWTAPEQFAAKAADGETDIYGVLHLPRGFDPAKRYPVIDSPYPGPHHGRLHPSFEGFPHVDREAEAIAALGFVVVTLDGRGTPGRSRAFHDHSYGRYDTAGSLEDHVAALRQLAASRPWMDLDRVGVYGGSGGGYATVRAMCLYPGFYKVGVAACGNHDQRFYQLAWGETYDGPYDAERYARSSNVEIADRLEGKLLLIHGEMDDNVHPHLTMRLVDRLIAADKDFDLLIVPGAEHLFVGYESYVIRRRWDFLVRHLMGVEPPPGYKIAPIPPDPAILSGLG